jgi:hypothetical protein
MLIIVALIFFVNDVAVIPRVIGLADIILLFV